MSCSQLLLFYQRAVKQINRPFSILHSTDNFLAAITQLKDFFYSTFLFAHHDLLFMMNDK